MPIGPGRVTGKKAWHGAEDRLIMTSPMDPGALSPFICSRHTPAERGDYNRRI